MAVSRVDHLLYGIYFNHQLQITLKLVINYLPRCTYHLLYDLWALPSCILCRLLGIKPCCWNTLHYVGRNLILKIGNNWNQFNSSTLYPTFNPCTNRVLLLTFLWWIRWHVTYFVIDDCRHVIIQYINFLTKKLTK